MCILLLNNSKINKKNYKYNLYNKTEKIKEMLHD